MSPFIRSAALISALAILPLVASPLAAQNPASPPPRGRTDTLFPDMAAMASNMAPMMQQMMTAQLTATLQFYARPETAELLAQGARNYYLALVRQGFTAEQAVAIVAAWRPTGAGPGR